MEKYDIVYILKNDISTDEIRYSLRSVEANLPCRKVWIYGGKPKGIEPDEYVRVYQTGDSRYDKVTNTIRKVCMNDEITDKFWLFNDDFFVMQKAEDTTPKASGTIAERVQYIIDRHGFKSKYAKRLEHTAEILRSNGYDTICYAVHLPMLIDRRIALEALDRFPGEPMFRCIYGNYAKEPADIGPDVKVFGNEDPLKNTVYLSTDDAAFQNNAGRYIRGAFPDPSRWEAGHA